MKLLFLILAGVCLVVSVSTSAEAKEFTGHSYSFTYPSGCKTDKEQNRYSDEIMLECKEDMMIQLNSGGITGKDLTGNTDEELADDMLNLFSTNGRWEDVSEVERGNITIGNESAPFVVATYTQTYTGIFGLPAAKTDEFVAMIIAIKTNDGYIVGQYKNNAGDFDKNKSMAEKIFQSVKAISPISPKDEKPPMT